MGLWSKIRGEFIDIVEWTDDTNDTMVWRFERHGNEIKYGARLTVRESQVAVFVNEGQIADVFEPGMYTLETQNVPVLSTLQGWKYGLQSPFKAEVYFVNRRRFRDLKWGTKNPVMLRDPEFGPIRLRAFGTYEMRVQDAAVFLKEVVGTDGRFTTDEIADQLRNIVVSRFSNVIGEAKIPVLDMAASYNDFGDFLTNALTPEFAAYGIELTKLLIENISLPPAVEEALDKRSSMGVIGDIKKYAQFQAAEAMAKAAEAPAGGAGQGMGLGMGFAMANQMAGMFNPQGQAGGQAGGQPVQGAAPAAAATPPPLPGAGRQYFVAVGGQQQGPFPMPEIQARVGNGSLTRQTLVWADGMANWTAAGEVPDLAPLFPATPPPLPGA